MNARDLKRRWAFRPRRGLALVLIAGTCFRTATAGAEEPGPGVVLKTLLSLVQRQGLSIPPETLREALVEAVVRAADPGASVLTPEAYERLRDRRRGRRRSAGLRIEWSADGDLTVVSVIEGSPAEQAGLTVGTVLDSVDEQYVSGRDVLEVLRWLDEGDGDAVRIDARAPDGDAVRTWTIERTVLPSASIVVAESWPKELAYMRVHGLHDDAAPSIAQQLRTWQEQGRYGIIVDLRGAAGERIDAAVALAGLLAERPEGASLVIEALDGTAVEEFMAVAGERIHLPAMVLVDGETQGAAELLAAVLRAAGRGAMLIGTPTAGDCGLREAVPFDEKTLLYMRVRRVLLGDEDVCDPTVQQGVEPHIRVHPLSDSAVRPQRTDSEEREMQLLRERLRGDAALQRAADVLLGLRALGTVVSPDEMPVGDEPE